jgi:RNA polymerase sigma factor (sigma-70 family)
MVSPRLLAIGEGLPHHGGMGTSGDGSGASSQLAREAQPLRQSLVRYFAHRLRDRSDVEDLVQEVFARIVARDSTSRIEHLGRYMYQTAGSVLSDYARRRSARRFESHIEFNPEIHGDVEPGAENILIGREDLQTVTAALLSLPERTRTIFVLRRLEGVRCRDVARQLGISESAVEKHMIRAVRHLGAAVGGEK